MQAEKICLFKKDLKSLIEEILKRTKQLAYTEKCERQFYCRGETENHADFLFTTSMEYHLLQVLPLQSGCFMFLMRLTLKYCWLWQSGREGSRPLPSPQTQALCRAVVAPAEFCIHVPASPEPARAECRSLPGERMVICVFISSSSDFVAIKKNSGIWLDFQKPQDRG